MLAAEIGSVADEFKNLTVNRLGAMGDGICDCADGTIYVAGGLPGETLRAKVDGNRASIHTILKASPDRVEPACPHFADCGGCSLQHMALDAYRTWKHAQVVAAFSRAGIDAVVEPMRSVATGTRRRAVLSARRLRSEIVLGYHQSRTHTVVPISSCLVLVPEIVEALPHLKAIAVLLVGRRNEIRLTVTATASGLDVAVSGVRKVLDADLRMDLAARANGFGLARLTVEGELIVEFTPPTIQCGRATVSLPAGAFLQATASAQKMLSELVLAGTSGAGAIIELFAGIGTFTFPMAQNARVHAIDGDRAAIAALQDAARRTTSLKPISAHVRDLSREPVSAREFNGFDAVVFDPPRIGARVQAGEIAGSSIEQVVAVSCNPATLARDVDILLGGGFKLQHVTPVDQFLFSGHIEIVAVLTR